MQMEKIICANGDSFTDEYYLSSQDRWTNILGINENLSLAGVSNERIFNTTIKYLNNNRPDIMIIGWTDWGRYMLPCNDGNYYFITSHHTRIEQVEPKEFDQSVGKFYFKHLHNDYLNFENLLNYIIFTQDYCVKNNIKILNFFSTVDQRWLDEHTLSEISETTKQKQRLEDLIEKIDSKHWINKKFYSMYEHCKDFPKDDTNHPGKEGSKHWAQLVKKYL